MERYGCRLGFVAVVMTLCGFDVPAVRAQTKDDPLVGRWVLDRAKSEFSGNVPEKRVTIFELTPDGGLKHIDGNGDCQRQHRPRRVHVEVRREGRADFQFVSVDRVGQTYRRRARPREAGR